MQLQAKDSENPQVLSYLGITAGSIQDIATQLYEELSSNGYSLLPQDVINTAVLEAQYYAAWQMLQAQKNATSPIPLDQNIVLEAAEWAILDPVIRAHCDLQQARLMEGSRSLGAEGFGLDVNIANQIYIEARKAMQDEAFFEPPFSYTTMSGK
jgi:hypothetical protein